MRCLMAGEAQCPIYQMYDIDGEVTADPDLVVSVVILLPSGDWAAAECKQWQIVDVKVN